MLSKYTQNQLATVLSTQNPALFQVASAHPNLLNFLTNNAAILQQILQAPQLIDIIIKSPEIVASNPSILMQPLQQAAQRQAQLQLLQAQARKNEPSINNIPLPVAPQLSSSSWHHDRMNIRTAWIENLKTMGFKVLENQDKLYQLENSIFQASPSKDAYVKNLTNLKNTLNGNQTNRLPCMRKKCKMIFLVSPYFPVTLPASLPTTTLGLPTQPTSDPTNKINELQIEQFRQFLKSNNIKHVDNANINALFHEWSMKKPSPELEKFAGQERKMLDVPTKNLFKSRAEKIRDAECMIEKDEYYFGIDMIDNTISKIMSQIQTKSNPSLPVNGNIANPLPLPNEHATRQIKPEHILSSLMENVKTQLNAPFSENERKAIFDVIAKLTNKATATREQIVSLNPYFEKRRQLGASANEQEKRDLLSLFQQSIVAALKIKPNQTVNTIPMRPSVDFNKVLEVALKDQQFMVEHRSLFTNPQANQQAIQKVILEYAVKKSGFIIPTSNPTSSPNVVATSISPKTTNSVFPIEKAIAANKIEKTQSPVLINKPIMQNQNAVHEDEIILTSPPLVISPVLIPSTPLPIVTKIPPVSPFSPDKDPLAEIKKLNFLQEREERKREKRKSDSDIDVSGIIIPQNPQKRPSLQLDNSNEEIFDEPFFGEFDKEQELNDILRGFGDLNSIDTLPEKQRKKSEDILSTTVKSTSPVPDVLTELRGSETEQVQSRSITLDDECAEMQKILGVRCEVFKHDNGVLIFVYQTQNVQVQCLIMDIKKYQQRSFNSSEKMEEIWDDVQMVISNVAGDEKTRLKYFNLCADAKVMAAKGLRLSKILETFNN
ncbi:hypothetical protein HK096_006262 [Nowakowskiella sp. JEL0078]|nr:hypothetical protein HK096_006262 [Nowakowskiella sp. JEL0078]